MPRQASFPFNGFHEGGLLPADVGPGATTQMQDRTTGWELCDFVRQYFTRDRVFIADIDVHLGGFHHVGANQRPFQEAVRVRIEEVLILEGPGLPPRRH